MAFCVQVYGGRMLVAQQKATEVATEQSIRSITDSLYKTCGGVLCT